MKKSKKFSLNSNDFLKGLVVSILTAVLTATYSAIQTGGISTINLELIATTTVLAGLSYLTKNLTENHEGEILKK